MPAYLIARIRVTDPEKYRGYMALSPAAIERHGGRFLARGGEVATLEGEPEERRVVIVEFPSLEAARTFYDSPEYRKARAAREGAAEAQFFVVEGLEDPAG
jgi:uncharacterized protein (DUF1330 family)